MGHLSTLQCIIFSNANPRIKSIYNARRLVRKADTIAWLCAPLDAQDLVRLTFLRVQRLQVCAYPERLESADVRYTESQDVSKTCGHRQRPFRLPPCRPVPPDLCVWCVG